MPLPNSGVRMRLATISKPRVTNPSVKTSATTSAAGAGRWQGGGRAARLPAGQRKRPSRLLGVVTLDGMQEFHRREIVGQRLGVAVPVGRVAARQDLGEVVAELVLCGPLRATFCSQASSFSGPL